MSTTTEKLGLAAEILKNKTYLAESGMFQQAQIALSKLSVQHLKQINILITEKCNDAKRETALAFGHKQFETPPAPRGGRKIMMNANDDSEEALSAAANNYRLLKDDWCKCKDSGKVSQRIAYFRSPLTGSHGWMCAHCHGIVQTG
jgi:hypothetical protein